MAWTASVPAAADKLSVSQAHIEGNFTQANTDLSVEHVEHNAGSGTPGRHKFPRGNQTTRDALTGMVAGTLFVRTDTAPQRVDEYDGTVWRAATWDGTGTIPGPLTIAGAIVLTSTLTLSGDPTTDLHATPRQYVIQQANLGCHEPCVIAINTDVTLSGEQTMDGVLSSANRVLLFGQSSGEENGPWITAAGAWTRPVDWDASADIVGGTVVPVNRGDNNAGFYQLTTVGTVQPSTTVQNFVRLVAQAPPFESSELAITNGGGAATAHGLGAVPQRFTAALRCTTGEHGYSIGDEIDPSQYTGSGGGEQFGMAVWVDDTNINHRFADEAAPFTYVNASTGVQVVLTITSWVLVLRAWVV